MKFKLLFILAVISIGFVSCDDAPKKAKGVNKDLLKNAKNFFQPITESVVVNKENPITDEKVLLGKVLYHDKNLSAKKNISCNSCHIVDKFGVDNLALSPGDEGKLGLRNSPTVINSAFQFAQFWDGRAKDIEEQAGMPILEKLEHNIPSKEFLEKRLRGISKYKELFSSAFPKDKEPITYTNIEKAIGAFERTLVATSRFDKYLLGDENALSVEEKKGLDIFINTGCITCHTGNMLGGNMMHKFPLFGKPSDYLKDASDLGKARDTKVETDKYMWKVSPLRNITKTAPYFHNGEVNSLFESIKIMAKAQLGKDLEDDKVNKIQSFLKSLEGDITEEQKTIPTEILNSLN